MYRQSSHSLGDVASRCAIEQSISPGHVVGQECDAEHDEKHGQEPAAEVIQVAGILEAFPQTSRWLGLPRFIYLRCGEGTANFNSRQSDTYFAND